MTFYGSEDLVEHIWSNLISNAIRFTPPGGQISVVLRQEGGEVCVTVSDTGCGMDEQTQAHIFDKFYKGAAQQSPGNGWGSPSCAARWSSAAGASASRPPPAAAAASS